MATRYSQKVMTDIKLLNYDVVQILYDWITQSVQLCFGKQSMTFRVSYERGDISCVTDSFEEFKQCSYGLNPIVHTLSIAYYDISLSFEIDNFFQSEKYIMVYSDKVDSISQVVESLKLIISNSKSKEPDTVMLPPIQINIGGDMIGSAIGVGNKVIHDGAINKSDGTNSFWAGVWQQITANWMWWLMGLFIAALVSYLGFS